MRTFQNVLFSHMYSHLVFLIAIFLKILKSFSLFSAIRDLKIRGRWRQRKRSWKYSRSFNLHRDCSKSLTLSNVGEPSVSYRSSERGGNFVVACILPLLVRSLLIGRRKQWHVILSIVSVLFGFRVRHHWWLLFRAASTWPKLRHFHVVVVQRRQRIVQKSLMHVQNCRFGY